MSRSSQKNAASERLIYSLKGGIGSLQVIKLNYLNTSPIKE
jgi:hypothetical protein